MEILGEKMFAKDAEGNLVSRVGTIFLKTPGLVTKKGIHAMQRVAWLDFLDDKRREMGLPPLSPSEQDAEVAESVDLVFTPDAVLVRPDPDRMDLAFKADLELQKLVSKRKIRFLNTHSAKVRNALRSRGENWRMARAPVSQDDMRDLVARSCVPLPGDGGLECYYNAATGTRYLTVQSVARLHGLEPSTMRTRVRSLQEMASRRNRMGRPELDFFPPAAAAAARDAFKALDPDALDDAALAAALRRIDAEWRMAVPPELREETTENLDWRNAMCQALVECPNDHAAADGELVQGISPEFFRQIEWLPGARVEDGEVIFDPLWDEYDRTRDPELGHVCDPRARNLLFNLARFFGETEYVNIGRIAKSLAREPIAGSRRGSVYIVQYKEAGIPLSRLYMLRFQKWGVAEHLDEGKDLLRAIYEANEYTDYILDRRLMCRQLGMKLPARLGCGHITERYRGDNQYRGTTVRTAFFARSYIRGTASDKIPPAKFGNPAFALRFARLMGEAAAIDMAAGRRSTETGENLFDKNYEVVQYGSDGLPARLAVTDHNGSFVNYLHSFADCVAPYANVVRRRKAWVADPAAFAAEYVDSFRRSLDAVRGRYRAHRSAYDRLFADRPFDVAGSGAYRWAKSLERLDACDPAAVAANLAAAIEA